MNETNNREQEFLEPPNHDVFHVHDDLKHILLYFKKCEVIITDIPFIKEKMRDILDQGLNFHAYLQRSISHSNKLEMHSEGAINYFELFEDPNIDQNRISGVLNMLYESTQVNERETREIKEGYTSIHRRLKEINDEIYKYEKTTEEKIKSLRMEKEDLEEDLKSVKNMISFFFMIGFILAILQIVIEQNIFMITSIIAVVLAFIFLKCNTNRDIKIRKVEREINDLDYTRNLINTSRREIEIHEIYDKMVPLIKKMGAYNGYWDSQLSLLEQIIRDFNINTDRERNFTMRPMKERWKEVRRSCDSYTRTARQIIKDVDNDDDVLIHG
ncbi:hypothetical protein C1645_778756 [Glomus cerebriforme]|uniref:Uncharacterized protein n=1 Tax=Glomus cerebriforme TaxID=658196 RepID=A0A397SS67_9GLOM|nr:hypothetical protein C1645_778756 [Glomus cerebriforme]